MSHQSVAPVESVSVPARPSPERVTFLLNKLDGLLHEEITAHGGAEAYMRWLRGEDHEEG